jgi:hypothetical protein
VTLRLDSADSRESASWTVFPSINSAQLPIPNLISTSIKSLGTVPSDVWTSNVGRLKY